MTMSLTQIEDYLTVALTTLRGLWPTLLMDSKGGSVGSASSDDVTVLDRRVSLRHQVTLGLNGWARVVVEDRGITAPDVVCDHPKRITLSWPMVGPLRRVECVTGAPLNAGRHPLLGHDTIGLCEFLERHAQWLSWHEAGPAALKQIQGWAGEVTAVALPQSRDWLTLGPCPFVVDPAGGGEAATHFCTGTIRGYGDPSRDPHCTRCHQVAVVGWWEEVLSAAAHLVTADELVAVVHSQFGRVVERVTIRTWVHRGWIVGALDAVGQPVLSDQGAMMFDAPSVVYDLTSRMA